MCSERRRHAFRFDAEGIIRYERRERVVTTRVVEAGSLAAIALAVLVGGGALLQQIALLHGVAVWMLAILAVAIIYAFRRNFRGGCSHARLHAARDAAFLAAIAAAIAFVVAPARWCLGSAIVAAEIGLLVELVSRFAG